MVCSLNVDSAPEWAWALLRSGALRFDESRNDVFNGLARCKQVKLWIWRRVSQGFSRHPKTGETVLHLLARSDALTTEQKLEVLAELKKDFRNPLIPNFKNQRAVDLTSDPLLKAELLKYMEFQADRSGDGMVRSSVSSASVHDAVGAETIACCGKQGHSQAAGQIHEQGGTHLCFFVCPSSRSKI
jgi:hypothetical protein